jgi:hypothetical protein
VQAAEIVSAGVPRQSYRPGETIHLNARVRPFRGDELVRPFEIQVPEDAADGTYQLTVSDVSRYLSEERSSSPYRFTASNLNEVFTVANELADLPSDAVYLRLVATGSPGIAVGRTAMTRLPPSQRHLLTNSGNAQISVYTPSTVRTISVPWVMTGSAELSIQVSRETRPASKAGVVPAPATVPHLP